MQRQNTTAHDVSGEGAPHIEQPRVQNGRSDFFQRPLAPPPAMYNSFKSKENDAEENGIAMLNDKTQTSVKSELLDDLLSVEIKSVTMLSLNEKMTDEKDGSVAMDDSVTMKNSEMNNKEGDESLQCNIVHQGDTTSIYRLKDPTHEIGGAMAVKVLTDLLPDANQISRLDNEHDMSLRLSSRCRAVRSTYGRVDKEGISIVGDGSHALFLEWVPGVTVSEWLRVQQKQTSNERNLEHRVSLAFEIARSLSEIHEVGEAALCNISVDNIIVNTGQRIHDENPTNRYCIRMIDLGSASLLEKVARQDSIHFSDDSEAKIRRDLRSLGEVLFELFSGESPFQSGPLISGHGIVDINCSNDHGDKRIRRPLTELQSILASSLIPQDIMALVLDLMETFSGERTTDIPVGSHQYYRSARDVEHELYSLLVDQDKKMSKPKVLIDDKVGVLKFVPGKLYGREYQKLLLTQAYDRVVLNNTCEIVLVSGFSGAGKTALVEEALRRPLVERGGHFLYIKFDQLRRGEPLAGMVSSLAEFCDSLVAGDADILRQTRNSIQKTIGEELWFVLAEVIPSLSSIIESRPLTEEMKVKGLMAQNQFKYVFQLLVRAFATPGNPTILFIDDLQWADKASLDLLHSLVLGSGENPVLFVECYRDNEISDDHLLATHLNCIKEVGVPFFEMQVGNLMRDDVNILISDIMNESLSQTGTLADVVYRKTGGNALLVTQLIKSLWDEGLLQFSFHDGVWKWDVRLIESKGIPDDAAELMARKIRCLPMNVQMVLKKMACLGSQCDESTLSTIIVQDDTDTFDKNDLAFSMLGIAACEGLIIKKGPKYKFAHDQIQHAAYTIIPESERGSWHLNIGKQLLKTYGFDELEDNLFMVVDQLNRGKRFITGEAGKIGLVKLNLQAGEKAVSTAAYSTAALFLKAGIGLLEKMHWKEHYRLCLNLYDAYAEAEYCNGNFKATKEALDCIVSNAKCYRDKRRAKCSFVYLLSSQGKNVDAIELGLDILAENGEPFQRNPDPSIIQEEFLKTKTMLDGKSFDDILARRVTGNKEIVDIMELLEVLSIKSYIVKRMLVPVFTFRMIQLSLRHGICESSAFAFSSYGIVLSSFFGDLKGAYHYGMKALDIMDRLNAKSKIARVVSGSYIFIFHWCEPLSSSLQPLLEAYKLGLNSGDNEYAFASVLSFCLHSFMCGKELTALEAELENFQIKAEQCQQEEMFGRISSLFPVIRCLIGKDGYLSLDDTYKTLELNVVKASESGDPLQLARIMQLQIQIYYLFGNYESAANLAEKCDADKHFVGRYCSCHGVFYHGLLSAALARINKDEKWINHLCSDIEKLRKYTSQNPSNCEQKLCLLEAELAHLVQADDKATKKCELAIELAARNEFIQDEAIAHERAGVFYLEKGQESKASHHYGKAHDAYLSWGAKRKADHLCERYPF